ncbi:MAG TPA: hypothetical protein DCS93_18040 [Microscillaceae bacterium]|nr:hypothetical protein [Microscillaceae bacterium]
MKKLLKSTLPVFLIIQLVGIMQVAQAQEFKIELKSGTLEIGEITGSIYLEAYDGSEIVIEGGRQYETPERARGLKSISSVNDNTNIGLNYQKNGNVVSLRAVRRRNYGGYRIKVPKDVKLAMEVSTSWCHRISLKGFSSDVNVTARHAKVELENLTGNVKINSRHGLVKANFAAMNADIDINARHGGMDITIPENAKADLRASTKYGEIYSNMEIKADQRSVGDMTSLSRSAEVNAKINGGGKRLRLSARHANIYLRKK